MLRGLATISYWADDLKAARAWYSELLGIAPYIEATPHERVVVTVYKTSQIVKYLKRTLP